MRPAGEKLLMSSLALFASPSSGHAKREELWSAKHLKEGWVTSRISKREGCSGREGREGEGGLWCVPTLTGFAVEELSLDVCLLIRSRDLLADTSPGNGQAKMSSLHLFGNENFQISYFMVI